MSTLPLRAAAAAALVLSSPAMAGFASQVVSYAPGSALATNPTFVTPSSALGSPDPVTGEGSGFPNVLSPFSPAYEPDEIVVIGDGGQLTLQLATAVVPGAGREVGVITNVGLIDTAFPGAVTGTPAGRFGGGVAEVLVSDDGVTFVSLGPVDFDAPAAYFTNAGAYDTAAPSTPVTSDFAKPFEGTLASFAGQDFTGVLATLNGSVGGTWIDLSPSGLASVQFIQFVVPDDGDPGSKLTIDAVTTIAGGGTTPPPVAVPLPAAVAMGLLAAPFVVRARKLLG